MHVDLDHLSPRSSISISTFKVTSSYEIPWNEQQGLALKTPNFWEMLLFGGSQYGREFIFRIVNLLLLSGEFLPRSQHVAMTLFAGMTTIRDLEPRPFCWVRWKPSPMTQRHLGESSDSRKLTQKMEKRWGWNQTNQTPPLFLNYATWWNCLIFGRPFFSACLKHFSIPWFIWEDHSTCFRIWVVLLLMAEILHQFIGSLSHYL